MKNWPESWVASDSRQYATRAVELLRQAVANGNNNFPHLLKDDDLAPLRGRDDFASLLWDIAESLPPTERQ